MAENLNPERIMQLGLGFWGSKTLLSAVGLGLFTELAKGPLKPGALSERLGLHQRGARDFLDALVALGMLQRDGNLYLNAPETDLFLDQAKPSYIGGLLEFFDEREYLIWGSLTEALRTGRPQNEIKGEEDVFAAIYSDPARLRSFLQCMTGISMGATIAIAQQFPWGNYQTFMDIGTAQGGLPVQLALAHSHLSGGGFDLPVVGPIFEEYINSLGLGKRLHFYPGDFFKDPLPAADVLIMGHVLQDWNLAEKRMLLDKAYKALPSGGALIIFEAIIDDERRENAVGLLMSLCMLLETQGGFGYTGADCCGWLREAGFRKTYVEHLVGPDSMVVGIK